MDTFTALMYVIPEGQLAERRRQLAISPVKVPELSEALHRALDGGHCPEILRPTVETQLAALEGMARLGVGAYGAFEKGGE